MPLRLAAHLNTPLKTSNHLLRVPRWISPLRVLFLAQWVICCHFTNFSEYSTLYIADITSLSSWYHKLFFVISQLFTCKNTTADAAEVASPALPSKSHLFFVSQNLSNIHSNNMTSQSLSYDITIELCGVIRQLRWCIMAQYSEAGWLVIYLSLTVFDRTIPNVGAPPGAAVFGMNISTCVTVERSRFHRIVLRQIL